MSSLTSSDWETSLRNDAMTFIDAIVLTILYSDVDRDETVLRQRIVFSKWLANYRYTLQKGYDDLYKEALRKAEVRGRIAALTTLPMKKSVLGEHVDLSAIITIINELKEQV